MKYCVYPDGTLVMVEPPYKDNEMIISDAKKSKQYILM